MTGEERLTRWRLVLGGGEADGTGAGLDGRQQQIDRALAAVYDAGTEGAGAPTGGLGASAPRVARWLGDIRDYFPTPVVRVIQQDAMHRLRLDRLLLEPEILETIEPDVNLVSTLLALNAVIPEATRATARLVVRRVVEDLRRRLEQATRQAVSGAIDRSARTRRPRRVADIDWDATIRRNLRHWQPAQRTLVAEDLVGHGRRRRAWAKDVILCVDQSGSMASSVVHSSVFAAVLASLPALRTRLVVFDTAVVDLSDRLHDPVEVLFGTQLGGGTDIGRALTYAQRWIERPADTIVLLISDLHEGGDDRAMLRRAASIVAGGARLIALLSLSDDGAPSFDHGNASALAGLGCPVFSCTPDMFPPMMAAAIEGRDVEMWAAGEGIVTARGEEAE